MPPRCRTQPEEPAAVAAAAVGHQEEPPSKKETGKVKSGCSVRIKITYMRLKINSSQSLTKENKGGIISG